jgi:type VI secretion system protein ImpM
VLLGDNMAARVAAGTDFAGAMSELRANGPELLAAASFWWTAGGGDFPPLALSCRGLPNPYRYSALLTADLADSPCEPTLAQGEA